MKLEVLSFSGKLFRSDNALSMTVTTRMGEITVLDRHTPLIASLKPSVLRVVYIDDNGVKREENFAIGGGILEVANSNVKVLVDTLVTVTDVDLDLAERAKRLAIETMEKYKNSKDRIDMEKFIEAEDELLKSIAQLKLGKLK